MSAKTKERLTGLKEGCLYTQGNHQSMKCDRCGGAMIFERFQATMEIFYAWRCVNCGDIMDPVVQKNRELVMAQKRRAAGE